MRSFVINSGAPYVFVVSVADATDAAASDAMNPFTLVLDAAFPPIQSLQPSKTGALTTGGIQEGAVAYNLTGPAAKVIFFSALGVGGTITEATPSVVLALNADGTPVLDGTTHLPTVTVGAGTITAGRILWVALVPASY